MDQINKALRERLTIILNFLNQSKQEFEAVSRDVHDGEIKRIIVQLVEKNAEYADQLTSTLESGDGKRFLFSGLGGSRSSLKLCYDDTAGDDDNFDFLAECSRNECALEKVYRDVLNSWFTQDGLRSMLKKQLNEIKYLFLKLKIRYMVENKMIYPHSWRRRVEA